MLTLMLLIMSFFYTSFISLIYFRQKHIETIELKIFSKLLCANVIGLVIEMMAKISSLVLSTENLMTLILCRAYLIYLVWFSLFIAEYVYSVSVNTKNSEVYFSYPTYRVFSFHTFNHLLMISGRVH